MNDDKPFACALIHPKTPSQVEIIFYFEDGPIVSRTYQIGKGQIMDKKIKKIQKKTKSLVKDEASLLKMDKKQDKIVAKAKKVVKKKKK